MYVTDLVQLWAIGAEISMFKKCLQNIKFSFLLAFISVNSQCISFCFKDRQQWTQRELRYWTYFRNYHGYDEM